MMPSAVEVVAEEASKIESLVAVDVAFVVDIVVLHSDIDSPDTHKIKTNVCLMFANITSGSPICGIRE